MRCIPRKVFGSQFICCSKVAGSSQFGNDQLNKERGVSDKERWNGMFEICSRARQTIIGLIL